MDLQGQNQIVSTRINSYGYGRVILGMFAIHWKSKHLGQSQAFQLCLAETSQKLCFFC